MCSPCPLNSSLWTPPPPPPPPPLPSPLRLWRRYLWYGYGYFVQPLNSSLGRLVISAFYPRSVLVTSMSVSRHALRDLLHISRDTLLAGLRTMCVGHDDFSSD